MIKDFGEKLLNRYIEETVQEKKAFKGVDIIDLPIFEKIFDVPIMVYEILNPLIKTKQCIFKTLREFENPKLHLVKVKHYDYAYILDADAFYANFICENCKKIFLTRGKHILHSKRCNNRKPKLINHKNRTQSIID